MSVQQIEYRVSGYTIELYGTDRKGKRTRWGDRIIKIFSDEKEVGQAVFAADGEDVQDSYCADGKIYYFGHGNQYRNVLDLLESKTPIHFAWHPVHDTKESNDGDALFTTDFIAK